MMTCAAPAAAARRIASSKALSSASGSCINASGSPCDRNSPDSARRNPWPASGCRSSGPAPGSWSPPQRPRQRQMPPAPMSTTGQVSRAYNPSAPGSPKADTITAPGIGSALAEMAHITLVVCALLLGLSAGRVIKPPRMGAAVPQGGRGRTQSAQGSGNRNEIRTTDLGCTEAGHRSRTCRRASAGTGHLAPGHDRIGRLADHRPDRSGRRGDALHGL